MRGVVVAFVAFVGLFWAGCGDDGAGGGTGGGTSAEAGPGGDGGPAGDGGDGGGSPCASDEDCAFVACCSCTPVTEAQDCSGLGCPSPDCTGLSAVCNPDGTCSSVLGNCDPGTVTCRQAPPACNGLIPLVVDGCYTGECVWVENCDPACAGGPCPWACPAGGDLLTTVEATDAGLVVEDAGGKHYDCTISFDEDSDAFDCTTLQVVGAEMTVTAGTSLAIACVEGSGSFAIPVGDPEQCALSCMLAPG